MGRVSKYEGAGVSWSPSFKCWVVCPAPQKGHHAKTKYTMDEDEALTILLDNAEMRRLREGSEAAELIDGRERRRFSNSHEFFTDEELEAVMNEGNLGGNVPQVDPQDSAMASTLRLSSDKRPVDLDRAAIKYIGDVSKYSQCKYSGNVYSPPYTHPPPDRPHRFPRCLGRLGHPTY